MPLLRRAAAALLGFTRPTSADLGGMLADHYAETLREVVSAKAEHREPAASAGEEAPTDPVVDLMTALEASVAKVRESRGESGPPATVHEIPKA
ncbi:hypothetical protein [Streptomyces sp. NPDC008122]|uniref:hypothetical protein n=1 Tax=Streptomyces sp. NPDC008122 TaxID=3364810 RepID=UPI0036E267AD